MKNEIIIIIFIFVLSLVQCSLNDTRGKLIISKVQTGQTHVIPGMGLSWNLPNTSQTLHLVGKRQTLLLLNFGNKLPRSEKFFSNVQVKGYIGSKVFGPLTLNNPSKLPPTESNGTKYSTTAYSIQLPATWIQPGLKIRAFANNYSRSDLKLLNIGASSEMILNLLPFYLYGANESNSIKYSEISNISSKYVDELFNKIPVSKISVLIHPVKRIDWKYLIMKPNGTHPSFKATNTDQHRGNFEAMGLILDIQKIIRSVNGDFLTNNIIYSPIAWLNSSGISARIGGGLGTIGGGTSTGDTTFAGVFIHELGHALSNKHAGEEYILGRYPYKQGSLLNSSWGYDKTHNEFLSITIPKTALSYKDCKRVHVLDTKGSCIKQSIMQSGAGDQSKGYQYSMFSDFECGKIQRYYEGLTTLKGTVHEYDGGRIFIDRSFKSGYSRWDSIDKKLIEFIPITKNKGLHGFNSSLPDKHNVPVYTIIATVSLAGTPNVSQIYPPLYYIGNMTTLIDPTNGSHLDYIRPNTGPIPWFCHASGCDFTIRVTYSDKSTLYILPQFGLRKWFDIKGDMNPDYFNPLKPISLKVFGVNIPANKLLKRFEFFFTPNGYNGFTMDSNPRKLIDFSCSGPMKKLNCSPSRI